MRYRNLFIPGGWGRKVRQDWKSWPTKRALKLYHMAIL